MKQTEEPTEELLSEDSIERLLDEAGRYLEAVALYRALGHEPRWRSEATSGSRVIALIAPYITA